MHHATRFALAFLLVVATAAAQDGKFTQKASLQKGQVINFRMTTETTTLMNMGEGMEMEIAMTVMQEQKHTVESVAADGASVVDVKFVRIHGTVDNPMMGEIAFDTDGQNDADPMIAQALDALTALKGSSLKVHLDAHGQVTKVAGMEEIVAKGGTQRMTGLDPGAFTMLFRGLPKPDVAAKEKWKVETTYKAMGLTMAYAGESQLTSVDADTLHLEAAGKLTKAVSKAELEAAGEAEAEILEAMKLDKGSLKTTSAISRKDGLPIKVVATQSAAMTIPSPMGEGSATMDVDAKTTLERVKELARKAKKTPATDEPKKSDK